MFTWERQYTLSCVPHNHGVQLLWQSSYLYCTQVRLSTPCITGGRQSWSLWRKPLTHIGTGATYWLISVHIIGLQCLLAQRMSVKTCIYHLRVCDLCLVAPQGVGSRLHGRIFALVPEYSLQWYISIISFIMNIYHLRDCDLCVVAVQGGDSLPYGQIIAPYSIERYHALGMSICVTTACNSLHGNEQPAVYTIISL